MSEGNGVNLDFGELKRVSMSEEGKWFEMLNGGQQFWSKETEQEFGGQSARLKHVKWQQQLCVRDRTQTSKERWK